MIIITPVHDRSILCPYCQTENSIVGSDLAPGTIISCSQCKKPIGAYSDMHAAMAKQDSGRGNQA